MPDAAQIVNAFHEYFVDVFRYRFTQYQGRARRKEFWMFVLFSFIISLVLSLVPFLGQILSGIYGLAVFVPGTCLAIRRLHDIGKSGWWLLVALIPLAGVFIVLYFYCQDSQPGENQYGPNPKEA